MEERLLKLYESLGEYFTGWHRKRWFYLLVALGLIACLLLQLKFGFEIGSDALSWVLSSIVQSLLALVALVGVVVVFRYQSMATREDRLLEELNKDGSDLGVLGQDLTSTSGEELLRVIKRIVPEVLGPEHGFRIVRLHKIKGELETQEFDKHFLGQYAFKLSIYAFSVTLVSLVFLSIAPLITLVPSISLIVVYALLFFVADIFRVVCKTLAGTLLH